MTRTTLTWRRRAASAAATLALALTGLAVGTAPAGAAPVTPSAVTAEVQTYNLDLGADLTPLFRVTTVGAIPAVAGGIYRDMAASNPPERMAAIARLIAEEHPDVVGLQEVATWGLASYAVVNHPQFGPVPVATSPYTTTYDFLALLLDALAARGTPYEVVAQNTNFDSAEAVPIAIPISATQAARYHDRDVIIMSRSALRHATASNPRGFTYDAKFAVNLLGVLPVSVNRGWVTVDVTERGRTFRFANTHLEAYGTTPLKDDIRNPQARQLAADVAASPYPVVLVGDINSRPTQCVGWRQPPQLNDQNVVATATLEAAGLREVWPLVYPNAPCDPASWTSGQADLLGPGSTLDHRIDVVMLARGLSALQADVVGEEQADRSTPTGYWPSDHASTVAKIRLNAAP